MVEVLKPGFYTTVQDLGRFDYQHYGVPVSGVMDRYSAGLANALLNNTKNAAVLEITMTGPKLRCNGDTLMCISGADISPRINSDAVKLNLVIAVKSGDLLSFGKLRFGFRCYLAVSGGFKSPKVMNSRSMYNDITPSSLVSEGDTLEISDNCPKMEIPLASIKIKTDLFSSKELDAFRGPEFDLLSKSQQGQLLSREFTIAKENNRMAYQLEETLANTLEPIITSLVLPGTVQLTPMGKLIILMRDGQTSGGYPRVLQLKESDLDVLSQKHVGHKCSFNLSTDFCKKRF